MKLVIRQMIDCTVTTAPTVQQPTVRTSPSRTLYSLLCLAICNYKIESRYQV